MAKTTRSSAQRGKLAPPTGNDLSSLVPVIPTHVHPEYEHSHEHSHEPISHEHSTVPEHVHGLHDHAMPRHDHGDLRGELRGAVRALLRVIESGNVYSAQRQALHAARVVIGDAHGLGCTHGKDPDGLFRSAIYDEHDHLVCDLCGADISAEASGKAG